MEFQKAIGVFAGFGNEILGMADTDIAVDRIKIPPTEIVGSFLAAKKICVSMEVVVVLPCVPETPMAFV